MGGCTDCSRSGGCGVRKGQEAELLGELLPRLYPTRTWGEPDDAACYHGGLGEGDARRLARRASAQLRAPAAFRPGGDGEWTNYVYVLCVGREPGLLELRDRDAIDLPDGDHVRERYLRAAISTIAPVSTVQEVSMELDREGDLFVVREVPRPGVFDPIVLKRTRQLVALLVEAGTHYLDFGMIEHPPEGFRPGVYEGWYGMAPATVNYLFYPQPATAVTTSILPCAQASSPYFS